MTKDDIRKLLGGYATNTLTEAERKTLFDAALEDQELFNALQDEEALKDLLADPVSRAQLQHALEEPVKTRAAWWSGRWAWTGAASAVAAAVIITGVVRMNAPRGTKQAYSADGAVAPATQPAQAVLKDKAVEPVTSTPAASKSAPPMERKREGRMARAERDVPRTSAPKAQNEKKEEAASRPAPSPGNRVMDSIAVGGAVPAPPPPPSSAPTTQQQVRVQAQAPAGQGGPSQNAAQNQNTANGVTVENAQNQFRVSDASAANARLAAQLAEVRAFGNTAALRYVLVKRDTSGGYAPVVATDGLNVGDEVRLNVTPIASGFLSLDRLDASGALVRVFPATGPGLAVVANTSYTIPDAPIEVQSIDRRFRLNLVSPAVEAATAARLKQSPSKAKADAVAPPMQRGLVAPSVEITIGPKRVP